MSKFNTYREPERRVREVPNATINFEGGLAYDPSDKVKLMKMVATSLVGESKFYQGGLSHDMEIIKLVHKIASNDPEFILKLAAYTRNELNLRSIPMMLIVEVANSKHDPVPDSRKYVYNSVQRVDELTEMIAYQLARNRYIKRGTILPMLIKNGIAMAFNKFNEYQFAKYNRKGDVRLKDALFLTHPKPESDTNQELFNKIVNDELATPETWETYISEHGSNTVSWTYIADKMPIFALVRNLRNLLDNNVDPVLYADKLRNPEIIKRSRMLPFRFYTAYKQLKEDSTSSPYLRDVLDALEDAMELSISNVEHLSGRTAIFIDVSGSMEFNHISKNSVVKASDISRLFGAMTDRICDSAIIGVFGQEYATVTPSKRASTLSKMSDIRNVGVGHATHAYKAIQYLIDNNVVVDRIIVFSDEQVYNSGYSVTLQGEIERYRNQVNPNTYLHSVDLMGYGNTIVNEADPRSNLIAGWSEKILDYISFYEKDMGSMVEAIESYTV